jgi:IS4 transposase
MGESGQPDCRWHGWRPVAVDGTVADVQCTEANTARFGRYGNQHGAAAYPQVRVVSLLECATRLPLGFAYDSGRTNEGKLADRMMDRLRPDMLILADRGFYSFARWRDWSARCGALVWRVVGKLSLKPVERLPDGSFLAWIRPSRSLCQQDLAEPGEKLKVRVVRYRPVMADGSCGETVVLITTVLDPDVAGAEELAALYPTRWAAETGFDELKTHLRGPGRVLRGQLPELVEQELYGFFLAYYVVRATMSEAACRDGSPPDRLSFVHAVRVIRRHAALFPSAK